MHSDDTPKEYQPDGADVERIELECKELERMEAALRSAESLASLMDSRFSVPGTDIRLGLDTLIGLIPGIGDTIGLGVSGYIISRAVQIGVPKPKLTLMAMNVFLDWSIGLIPLIGDIFDWGWKANNRNAHIMRSYFNQHIRGENAPGNPNSDSQKRVDLARRLRDSGDDGAR